MIKIKIYFTLYEYYSIGINYLQRHDMAHYYTVFRVYAIDFNFLKMQEF